ncbi:hypothetical protein ACN6LC_003797 [Streptomyces violaceoruber]|uniref:hypothetical protein n=1 Tax=Streptomyces violaceoruber TaxID=1935 RepID=UPI00403C3E17
MHEEQSDHHPALIELRRKLNGGLARARLDKTQLATRAQLGRTTVSEAFGADGRVPSEKTVAALARALKLPMQELLELQRTAAASDAQTGPGPGRPISEWEPHALEIHPAGPASAGPGYGSPEQRALPGYVPRPHDRILAQAVREAGEGHSRMLVLVGTSSTGKTRACWEAVQALAEKGWRLWHPFDPTRAEAALDDLHRVRPRTVIWLNEAQHYFGDPRAGERIAAAVHGLLVQPERGPVLALGTLWPEYAAQYAALPTPDGPDPHSRVRELLTGRTLTVPEAFDPPALAAANGLAEAGDHLLADALNRASADGRLTQDLAGAPELLQRYQSGTPAAKAVLEAAMDARRLDVGLHLPQAFLTDAALDYLSDIDHDQLTDDWAEAAFAELAHLVHGKQAPLRRVNPRPQRRLPGAPPLAALPQPTAGPVFRLADYLEQHGRATRRRLCPPASLWQAAYTHLTDVDDLLNLAEAARFRYRNQWALHLRNQAHTRGPKLAEQAESPSSIVMAPENEGPGELSTDEMKEIEGLISQVVDTAETRAFRLAQEHQRAGDLEAADLLLAQAADGGHPEALFSLARRREATGNDSAAEALYQRAVRAGYTVALVALGWIHESSGDLVTAEAHYQRASDAGIPDGRLNLARMREQAGDRNAAEALAQEAADAGDTSVLTALARIREQAGDTETADALAVQAAEAGNTSALIAVARMREASGNQDTAEILYRRVANYGGLWDFLQERWPHGLNPDGTPTQPWV